MVQTVREMKDKTTQETRLYITSSTESAEFLMNAVRKHWSIENQLHWTLDVTFKEDRSRIRTESSPENYAMIRHIAMNILRSYKEVIASVKRKIQWAALDDDFRTKLILHSF